MPGIYIPTLEDTDPSDPESWGYPSVSYIDIIKEPVTVEVGKRYVASIYLKHATAVTLYLRLGVSVVPISVSSTLTRFEVSAVATSTTLDFCVSTKSGDYSSLSLVLAWAKVEEGSTATTYCSGTYTEPWTVSSTGLVEFASAPTGALTWTGDYYTTATYEIATPWGVDDLPSLRWTQSADVLIFAHEDYPPQWLGRYDHADWRIKPLAYTGGPFNDLNTDTAATITTSAISGTCTLTAAKAVFTDKMIGRQFRLEAKDMGQPWEAGKSVSLYDIRYANNNYYLSLDAATTGTLRPSHLSDIASDGVVDWQFQDNGFGIVRIVNVTDSTHAEAFVVSQLPKSLLTTGSHKWASEPWNDEDGYPRTVTYHQQRLVLAGTPAKPDSLWTSKTGLYLDFGTTYPTRDDDGLTARIISSRVNKITGLTSLGCLLALTEGGAWMVGTDEPLTPATLGAKLQGYRGCSSVEPLGVGNAILYVQGKANNVRDLTYEFVSNSYNGNNLNAFAPHLVEGYTIEEWAYQESSACLWAIRDDGTLLGCTYMRDQEICGWHRHDTDGTFESLCCVSEGDEDALYVSVLRGTKRFIERFATRLVTDVRDGWFVDCGLFFNGDNTSDTTVTVTVAAGVYTATASAALFAAGDVGSEIDFYDSVNKLNIRFAITGFTSATAVTVLPNRTPDAAYLNAARADWAWGRKTFTGLDHLEGKVLSILADGAVYPHEVTVTSGTITLDRPAYRVIAGLPYTQDIETLGLNVHGEGAIEKKRIVKAIRCMVGETWSISCGSDEDRLRAVKVSVNTYDDPAPMQSGLVEKTIDSTWDKQGRVLIRNTNPLPVSILAILPEIIVGGA